MIISRLTALIMFINLKIVRLDAIASTSTYPCQWVGQWVSEWFIVSDLEITIAFLSFVSLFNVHRYILLQ